MKIYFVIQKILLSLCKQTIKIIIMTQITKLSLQITTTCFSVFTEYNNLTNNNKTYKGHEPYKNLEDAISSIYEKMAYNGSNGFRCDLIEYDIITFDYNDKPVYKTVTAKLSFFIKATIH
jgi:hypothetical protein